MKKTSIIISAIFTLVIVFSACKKKESCAPLPNYTGKWVGKYGSGAATPTSDYTLFLNADGELGVIDGLGTTPQAKGTWTVIGSTLRGTYKYLPTGSMFSIQATVSADGKSLTNGTYGSNFSVSGSGTFIASKQ
jgi:hypothetical protein